MFEILYASGMRISAALSLQTGAVPLAVLYSVRNGTKALTRQVALLEIKEAAVAAGLSSPERVSP